MADKDLLLAWLRDAHAMEIALIPVLENHARDVRHDTAMATRIDLHAEQTRRHAELLEGCLERLGSSPSAAKTGLAGLFGALQSVSTGLFQDEPVKNALADYAAEHFEIACYRALIAAAEASGENDIAHTCTIILQDEEEMSRWLAEQLPVIVRRAVRPTQTSRS